MMLYLSRCPMSFYLIMTQNFKHDSICIGRLFIVSATSGAGKTSLVRYLVDNLDNIVVSISHTTRVRRPAEVDAQDYFFVDDIVFNKMINHGEFIEYARVFGALYGTSRTQILTRLEQGIDVVLDIDWQGALQIKHLFPSAVGVFILPPSLAVLKQRLLNRQQDNKEVIVQRMQRARDEIKHYNEFDYLIVNDDFGLAAQDLIAIVVAERLKLSNQLLRQQQLLISFNK